MEISPLNRVSCSRESNSGSCIMNQLAGSCMFDSRRSVDSQEEQQGSYSQGGVSIRSSKCINSDQLLTCCWALREFVFESAAVMSTVQVLLHLAEDNLMRR